MKPETPMSHAALETAIEAAWEGRDTITPATRGEARDAVEDALRAAARFTAGGATATRNASAAGATLRAAARFTGGGASAGGADLCPVR